MIRRIINFIIGFTIGGIIGAAITFLIFPDGARKLKTVYREAYQAHKAELEAQLFKTPIASDE